MTWGDVYNRYLKSGHDHGSAAFAADQWQKRQHKDRWKHCPSNDCTPGVSSKTTKVRSKVLVDLKPEEVHLPKGVEESLFANPLK